MSETRPDVGRVATWLVTALMMISIFPNRAFAHAVGADCVLKGDFVEVEGYFDDDTATVQAKVVILKGDQEIAKGVTDKYGKWSFPKPAPGKYTMILDAGAGHKAQRSIVIAESATETDFPAKRPSSPNAVQVSEGPDRTAFTQFPWLRVLAGLGIIAATGMVVWLFRAGRTSDK